MFNGWVGYEGTIKKNEVEMYLTLRGRPGRLHQGAARPSDAAAMTAAAATFADTAKAYLAKHP